MIWLRPPAAEQGSTELADCRSNWVESTHSSIFLITFHLGRHEPGTGTAQFSRAYVPIFGLRADRIDAPGVFEALNLFR